MKFKVGDRVRVSHEDLTLLDSKWHIRTSRVSPSYLKRDLPGPTKTSVYLHRVVMERVLGTKLRRTELVDHIDGDTFNNLRSNLRVVDRSQNALNGLAHKDSKSPYRGVRWHTKTGKWHARIQFQGNAYSCGYYHSPELARDAYLKKAVELGCHVRESLFGEKRKGNK